MSWVYINRYNENILHGLANLFLIGIIWNSNAIPDSKVHGANTGPVWDQQDPGGPHVGPVNFVIWDIRLLSVAFKKFHWTPSGTHVK